MASLVNNCVIDHFRNSRKAIYGGILDRWMDSLYLNMISLKAKTLAGRVVYEVKKDLQIVM